MEGESAGVFKALDFLWYCFKLIVLVALMFYIVVNTFLNSGKTIIENNWTEYRCSPMVMPFADKFGRDVEKNAMNCMFTEFKTAFGFLMKPLQYIMKIVHDIMQKHNTSMNMFRAILKPIRIFFMTATKQFYDMINRFSTMTVYLFAKIRDTLRRIGSTFMLSLYSLQAIQLTIKSIWDGPVGTVSRDFVYALDAIRSFFCLAPDCLVKMADGTNRPVSELQIGDRVSDGFNSTTEITGMVTTSSQRVPLYQYRGITISGNHLVSYQDSWRQVKEIPEAILLEDSIQQQYPVLYCPLTETQSLELNHGLVIRDFEEISDPHLDRLQLERSLQYLNRLYTPGQVAQTVSSDQPGFAPGARVVMEDGSSRRIETLQIGDRLSRGRVLGLAVSRPESVLMEISPGLFSSQRQILKEGVSSQENETSRWLVASSGQWSGRRIQRSQRSHIYSLITSSGVYQVGDWWASDLFDGLPGRILEEMELEIQDHLNE